MRILRLAALGALCACAPLAHAADSIVRHDIPATLAEADGAWRVHGEHWDRSVVWGPPSANLLTNFGNMYNLNIVHEPDDPEYPFKGWFFGWAKDACNPGFPGCDAIYAARSPGIDGPWEVYSGGGAWDATMDPSLWVPVIAAQDEFFDEWHNGDPAVVRHEGRYYMAYSSTGHNLDGLMSHHVGPDGEGDTDGSILCVMGAVSDDGIHWERTAMPILMNPDDVGGATVDGHDIHMFGSYHRPSLMRQDGVWRLWFDYWGGDAMGGSMGYAENHGDFMDPDQWVVLRAADFPLLAQFPNPNVVRVGDLYFAYSDKAGYDHLGHAAGWTGRKIAEAVSTNGINWIILGYMQPDEDAAANHVPEALVLEEDGEPALYLFYATQRGGPPGAYDYQYDNIRYRRRHFAPGELDYYRALCAKFMTPDW